MLDWQVLLPPLGGRNVGCTGDYRTVKWRKIEPGDKR